MEAFLLLATPTVFPMVQLLVLISRPLGKLNASIPRFLAFSIRCAMKTREQGQAGITSGEGSSGTCKRKEEQQQQQPKNPNTPKKPRLVFTDLQRRTLQAIFKETKRPSKEMQITISQQLGLELSTVGNFFMNARRRSQDKWQDGGGGEEGGKGKGPSLHLHPHHAHLNGHHHHHPNLLHLSPTANTS